MSDDEPNLPTGILVDKNERSSTPLEVRLDKTNIWVKRKRPPGEGGVVNLHMLCSGGLGVCRPDEEPSVAYVAYRVESRTLEVKFASDKFYTAEYYYALTGKRPTGKVTGTKLTLSLEPKP